MRRLLLTTTTIALLALALAGCGGSSTPSDNAVASSLTQLLTGNGVQAADATCAHQNGNQYACQVTAPGGPYMVQVTDDGHSIAEQGIGAPQTTTAATASEVGQPAEGSACTQAGGGQGVIVIEGPTAADPGQAECVP